MAFTAYTDQQVFDQPIINVACNAIITELEERNKSLIVPDIFALTGTPAKILQGAANTDVQNVPFITSDTALFNFLKNNLSSFLPDVYDVIKRKEVLKFKFTSVFFEIHLEIKSITTVDVNGVSVQETSEIPNFIL